ncbi:DinB family protein [Paenibacillus sp. B2(2019)]|uniref:DinB family protein n=1 Tax=Paenibacillus sp. B2(2019) TaxID=2607754 RepID=UPI0011F25334|nr:DinB family protein [Paenibacillus sp. B2(2019)]KAA1186513.1 DinB family protein [Paenibacillus sp. B2(2019)]
MSRVQISDYLKTYHQLVKSTAGLTEEQLKWKAEPASWSVTEVLTHLADHIIVVSFRIRDILAATTAQLPVFNQDAWVSGQYANSGNASDNLELFRSLLYYNSLLFERLSEEDWEKSGINFKGEAVKISDIVHGFTGHVERHLGQIERIKQGAANASFVQ